MVSEGLETTGTLVDANRVVDEGVFQSNAVAHLIFDLGKYGEYPVTLALPDGPNDYSEFDEFMDKIGYDASEIETIVNDKISIAFVRRSGEWSIEVTKS